MIHLSFLPWLGIATTRLLATFAVSLGLSICLTDPIRWSGPTFASALAVPGAPPVWGVVLLVGGGTALIGSLRKSSLNVVVGMMTCAAWCVFFGAAFFRTAWNDDRASTTGVFAYGFMAVLFGLYAAAHRRPKNQETV